MYSCRNSLSNVMNLNVSERSIFMKVSVGSSFICVLVELQLLYYIPKIDRTRLIFTRLMVFFTRNRDFKVPVKLVPGKVVLVKISIFAHFKTRNSNLYLVFHKNQGMFSKWRRYREKCLFSVDLPLWKSMSCIYNEKIRPVDFRNMY